MNDKIKGKLMNFVRGSYSSRVMKRMLFPLMKSSPTFLKGFLVSGSLSIAEERTKFIMSSQTTSLPKISAPFFSFTTTSLPCAFLRYDRGGGGFSLFKESPYFYTQLLYFYRTPN